MTAPRVTVLMSAYNAERYVGEAVESVLAQTLEDFELLIFEDASTDATASVLRRYGDPRIRIVRNCANAGLTRNLVAGMNMARGALVARMDADDVCEPQRLARQVAYLESHPEIAVLGSAVTFFTTTGSEFVAHQPLDHEEIKCTLLYGYTMLHPSVMMCRAELAGRGLTYDTAFAVSQDHDLWTRAIRQVRFANLHEPLLRMREHDGKIGRSATARQRTFSDRVRRRQLDELGVETDAEEFALFGQLSMDACAWTTAECETLEHLLLRIFEANARKRIFDPRVLVRTGSARFREKCRQLLIAGNPAGRYYWRSAMRRLDDPTPRQLSGLLVRSVLGAMPSRLTG